MCCGWLWRTAEGSQNRAQPLDCAAAHLTAAPPCLDTWRRSRSPPRGSLPLWQVLRRTALLLRSHVRSMTTASGLTHGTFVSDSPPIPDGFPTPSHRAYIRLRNWVATPTLPPFVSARKQVPPASFSSI